MGKPVIIETEMGFEKQCGMCEEFWPLDEEFWYVLGKCTLLEREHSYCKACVTQRKAELRAGAVRRVIRKTKNPIDIKKEA